jgi:hemoglobin-like flavoprotein
MTGQTTPFEPAEAGESAERRRRLYAAITELTEGERLLMVREFYDELFGSYPRLGVFFGGLDIDRQAQKLAAALEVLVACGTDRQLLGSVVVRLGCAHAERGIGGTEYVMFASTLARVLARYQTELSFEQADRFWVAELTMVVDTMMATHET